MDLPEIALGPAVNERHDGRSAEQTKNDASEADTRQALRDAVCILEDVGVAVQKREEDDVNDREVEGKNHDDRLSGSQNEWAV